MFWDAYGLIESPKSTIHDRISKHLEQKLAASWLRLLSVRPPGIAPRPDVRRMIPDKLELFIHKVTCVTESPELGKDEILMASIDRSFPAGTETVTPPFSVGKFHRGGSLPLPTGPDPYRS